MTSNELCEAINASLFVPMTEDLGKQLLEVTKTLIPSMETVDVDNCSRAFFRKEVSPSYKGKFKTQYKSTYGEELKLPDIAFVVLETYQVLLLLQSDSVEDNLKAKCSLIVKNNAIWRKGDWYDVMCPSWIELMYSYYQKHGNRAFTGYNGYDSLLKAVVHSSSWNNTGMDLNDPKTYNSLRNLCTSVVRGRIGAFSKTPAFKNLRSPFSRVYLLVSKMVKEWQWKYIDNSPVKRIIDALGDDAKKRKSLSKIVEDVKGELPTNSIVVPNEKSSVLLSKCSGGKNSELDGKQYSVLEFGIYLYYELLLETYND